MATATLRTTGDGAVPPGGPVAFQTDTGSFSGLSNIINQVVTEPSTPSTAHYITGQGSHLGQAEQDMPVGAVPGNINTLTDITVWAYGTQIDSGPNGSTSTGGFGVGTPGIGGSGQTLAFGTSPSWQSTTFSGLSLTQAQANQLFLSLQDQPNGFNSDGGTVIYAAYMIITYTPTAGGAAPCYLPILGCG